MEQNNKTAVRILFETLGQVNGFETASENKEQFMEIEKKQLELMYLKGKTDVAENETFEQAYCNQYIKPHLSNAKPINSKSLLEVFEGENDKDIISKLLMAEELIKNAADDALVCDGFDLAVIGTSYNGRIVYDCNRMEKILMERDGMSHTEAIEYLEFNVYNAHVSDMQPIYIHLDMDLCKE